MKVTRFKEMGTKGKLRLNHKVMEHLCSVSKIEPSSLYRVITIANTSDNHIFITNVACYAASSAIFNYKIGRIIPNKFQWIPFCGGRGPASNTL